MLTCLVYPRGEIMATTAIILAAGQGQRMESAIPKPLHKVAGLTMIEHVVKNVQQAKVDQIYLVVGHEGELVRQAVPDLNYVVQEQRLGTGHAVDQCRDVLRDFDGSVLVTYADTPLFRSETFAQLLEFHQAQGVAATVITANLDDPQGYGRVIRNANGYVSGIVEDKDADQNQKQISEINTGTYCFDSKLLFKYLEKITPDNAQAEYYLPDVIPLMIADNHLAAAFCISDATESMGINDRIQLAEAEEILQQRIIHQHMLAGVTFLDPNQTYLEYDCKIGRDTIIYPHTVIQNGTEIGQDCEVGPQVRLHKAKLGNYVKIEHAVVVDSEIGNQTTVGPFAYIRSGSSREDGGLISGR